MKKYIASAQNATQSVTNLLKAGTDPNNANEIRGWTPLMVASSKGYDNTVELLLQYGADTNIQDETGRSALYLACHSANYKKK